MLTCFQQAWGEGGLRSPWPLLTYPSLAYKILRGRAEPPKTQALGQRRIMKQQRPSLASSSERQQISLLSDGRHLVRLRVCR
jgi:hypothetical protein